MTEELLRTSPVVLDSSGLAALIEELVADGRTVIAPTARDGAIVLAKILGIDDLPVGYGDEQEPGRYRLRRRGDSARFGYAAPAQSWKRLLFPGRSTIWQARIANCGSEPLEGASGAKEGHQAGFTIEMPSAPPRYAFLGARACDLEAIAIQDRVFLGGPHEDRHYRATRDELLLVAVSCSDPADTCFCTSMGTGPRVGNDVDVLLTEVMEKGATEPSYVAEAGTDRGTALLDRVPHRASSADDLAAAEAAISGAERRIRRAMPDADLHAVLSSSLDHPRWDHAASRCLSCTSCTLVCPTCFCSSIEDVTDLTGAEARRERRWASCFELDHSYLHGGSVRVSIRARYRQWLTHKLSTWFAQFGTSGCVGCGRCISWCPVGIDITEEVREIARAAEKEVVL